jgi:hypothetical protein
LEYQGNCQNVKKDTVGMTLFVASLCFVAFVYGVATAYFNLWPNAFLTDAKNALIAVIAIAEDETKSKKVPSLELIEPDGYTRPTVIAHTDPATPENGYVFVDGGNNQLRSHCPEHGCIAWLMDRTGEIAHIWDIGPELLWRDLEQVAGYDLAENAYSVGSHLYTNGDLIVIYQGWNTFPYGLGIARFDKDSNLLWKKENFSHHWISVDDSGLIYASTFREIDIPHQLGNTHLQLSCPQGAMYEDVIVVLDANGTLLDEISVIDAFVKSGYSGAIFEHKHPDYPLPLVDAECDPTHLNDVRVISAADAASSTILNAGDLLVSLRSTNTVAVIDGVSKRVKWLSAGRTVQQHSPRYLGNDQLIIFDNLGGRQSQGGSQLVRLNMLNDAAEVLFPLADTPDDINFLSATAGHIALNADNSRAIVSLTRQGRSLEIELATGRVLWEYINTHNVTGIVSSENDAPVYARFATQTLSYVDDPAFELNGGKLR